MTETVVHVTTIEEWKSVLDVWFKQGYDWSYINKGKGYKEGLFYNGSRQLGLNVGDDDEISYWSLNGYNGDNLIEYSEFMAQQKGGNNMETYYVTRDQYALIEDLKDESINRLDYLLASTNKAYKTFNHLHVKESNALLRYLGGDTSIKFEIKDPLYRLWRIDDEGDTVYMIFLHDAPDWTRKKDVAFTAPLEEIKKHKTISWDIEEVN